MSLLAQFMNNPSTTLGLSVLANPSQPAAALLHGLRFQREQELARLRGQMIQQEIQKYQQAQALREGQMAALQDIMGAPGEPVPGPVMPGQAPLTRGGTGAMAATSPGGQQVTREELQQGILRNLPGLGVQGAASLNPLLAGFEKTPEQIQQEAFAGEAGRRRAASAIMTPSERASMLQASEAMVRKAEEEGFDRANTLRDEFMKNSKGFVDVRDAYKRVLATRQDTTGASDMALIFGFMKMLDPGSVVREGEFATAENAGGIPAKVRNMYNKAMSGEFLTPEMRQDFVNQAQKQYEAALQGHTALEGEYTRLSDKFGVPASNVIVDFKPNQYLQMTNAQLMNVDPASLNDAQLRKLSEALNANP